MPISATAIASLVKIPANLALGVAKVGINIVYSVTVDIAFDNVENAMMEVADKTGVPQTRRQRIQAQVKAQRKRVKAAF